MFTSFQRPAGREYTITVTLLAVALIFIPALASVSQPWSYSPALGASAICLTWHGSTGRDLGRSPFPRLPPNKRLQNDSGVCFGVLRCYWHVRAQRGRTLNVPWVPLRHGLVCSSTASGGRSF